MNILKLSNPAMEIARCDVQLQNLFVSGAGDSPEADQIREIMAGFWPSLDMREQKLLEGLAEDLNSLLEGRINFVTMSRTARADFHRKAAEAVDLMRMGDPENWLMLLREEMPSNIPSWQTDQVRLLQAAVWEKLGLPFVALLFMTAAANYNPIHQAMVLRLLRLCGDSVKEYVLAKSLISRVCCDPATILQAAGTIFNTYSTNDANTFKADLIELAPVLRQALQKAIELSKSPGIIKSADSPVWQEIVSLLAQYNGHVHGFLQSIDLPIDNYHSDMLLRLNGAVMENSALTLEYV